ncbi:MAG: Arc family DNA-binding protein [Chloroflexi bacterium]|nr:Arc family DNA-binding protein [Chloroflexota bacterium]
MANLTIKNIPDELYTKLKSSAEANRRSMNSEVIMLIERYLRKAKPNVELIEAKAAKIRERTAHYTINEEELEAWINKGRS